MNDTLESLGRIRVQAFVLLAVVFLVGALAGGAADRVWFTHGGRGRPPFGMRAPGGLPPSFERLGLSADQKTRIGAIFERRRARMDSLMQQTMPRIRSARDSVEQEIRGILTPEQREQLDRETANRRRRGFGPGMGPPRGPDPEGPPRPDGPRS